MSKLPSFPEPEDDEDEIDRSNRVLGTIGILFPGVSLHDVHCPACPSEYPPHNVGSVIMHLNDTHWWSRERIADWLDELPWQFTL